MNAQPSISQISASLRTLAGLQSRGIVSALALKNGSMILRVRKENTVCRNLKYTAEPVSWHREQIVVYRVPQMRQHQAS
jgi:hypothetical protein